MSHHCSTCGAPDDQPHKPNCGELDRLDSIEATQERIERKLDALLAHLGCDDDGE